MNKKTLLIIVGLVLVITGALAYVFISKGDREAKVILSSQQDTSTKPSRADPPAEAAGTYMPFTYAALAAAEETTILLFFYAPWCPQCREVEKTINEGGVPSGVTVLKVDYDTNQALRQKYDVTLQTTFVKVDKGGNRLASYVAYEEPSFGAVKRNLLP